MTPSAISRRTVFWQGGAALAGLSVLRPAGPAHAVPLGQDAEVVPWLDQAGATLVANPATVEGTRIVAEAPGLPMEATPTA